MNHRKLLFKDRMSSPPVIPQFYCCTQQDCNFHECAKLDEFESMRQLSFTPPDGEFVLLNYRINAEFRCPFRLFPSIGDIDPYRYSTVYDLTQPALTKWSIVLMSSMFIEFFEKFPGGRG